QEILFLRKKIVDQSLNVRATEIQVNLLKQKSEEPKRSKKTNKDIFIRNLQIELERKLGTKVEIAANQKGGKVVIKYYSNDDLERIMKMFN
ncbi:MAG: ParB/RepB/Spo0J family partition protein, partial [Nitrospinaceae bacterium]